MFDRLSRESLVALQIGSAESRAANQFWLGTEHLAIGCKLPNEDLESAMQTAGLDPKRFRRHLREVLGTAPDPAWGERLVATPRLEAIVRIGEKIANYYQRKDVLPLHLLLAMLVEGGVPYA